MPCCQVYIIHSTFVSKLNDPFSIKVLSCKVVLELSVMCRIDSFVILNPFMIPKERVKSVVEEQPVVRIIEPLTHRSTGILFVDSLITVKVSVVYHTERGNSDRVYELVPL